MKELPRLELTEDPSKSNDFIIFRHSIKGSIKKTSKKCKLTLSRRNQTSGFRNLP